MPIVEIPSQGDPLSYGDVLKDISLFETPTTWQDSRAAAVQCPACLILSRPCVISNKQKIVVVGVVPHKGAAPSDVVEFEQVFDFITSLRDGDDASDCFYLGQIEQLPPGRYMAKLDALYTVRIDRQQLPALVSRSRIARLSHDFARDLQVRLFTSYAKMGFDDYTWLPTADLEWLVTSGDRSLNQVNVAEASANASGHDTTKFAAQRSQLIRRIEPFKQEQSRRRSSTDVRTGPSPPLSTSLSPDPIPNT